MKVLSLHQPWATLVALGVKTIETRSWPAPRWLVHRFGEQRIAIHAAATPRALDYLCWEEDHLGETPDVLVPVRHLVREIDYSPRGLVRAVHDLPLGAIVATAVLADCIPMVHTGEEGAIRTLDIDGDGALWVVEPARDEEGEDFDQVCVSHQAPFGDFKAGRWAWLLEDVQPLREPVPFRGGQGLTKEWTP